MCLHRAFAMHFGCWTATSRLPRSRGCSMKGFFYCACLCTPSITSRICGTTFSLAGVRMFLCWTDISQPRSQGLSIFRSHLPRSPQDERPCIRIWNSRPFIQLSTTSGDYYFFVLSAISYFIFSSVNHYSKIVWCSYLTGFSGVLTFCVYLPYMQFKISRVSAGSVQLTYSCSWLYKESFLCYWGST